MKRKQKAEPTTKNPLIPLSKRLLELRDIVGFSADYFQLAFQSLDNKTDQHIVFTLCNNLQRAKQALEHELLALGRDVREQLYEPAHFSNVEFLNINIMSVVEEFVEQQKDKRIKSTQYHTGKLNIF